MHRLRVPTDVVHCRCCCRSLLTTRGKSCRTSCPPDDVVLLRQGAECESAAGLVA